MNLPALKVELHLIDTVVNLVAERYDLAVRHGPLSDWFIGDNLTSGRLVDLFPHHTVSPTHFQTAISAVYPSRKHVPRRKVKLLVAFLKRRQWADEWHSSVNGMGLPVRQAPSMLRSQNPTGDKP